MDQRPLVDPQIDDGFKLARGLAGEGLDVTAAFWARSSEEGEWALYVASKVFDDGGTPVAYRTIVEALRRLEDPWVSISEIKAIGERSPITQEVLGIMRRRPGPMALRSRSRALRDLGIEEVYIDPPVEGPARRPPPHVRVIGLKRVVQGNNTEESPEEVGQVEGFIGEAEFNTRLSELIRSKFGSPEQFAAAYPRVLLEEIERR
jgi:hypothetical protein